MEEELNSEEIADQVPNQVENEVQEQKVRNEAQETGKTDEQPKKAQRKPNSKENGKPMKSSENVKKNGTQITSQLQNRVINDQKANEKNDSRINAETQEKSKTYKGKGKKPQKKKGELQQKQPSQPQTGPRVVRQSGQQPTRAPEPLPGGSNETDQSVSKREKLEGQVRKEGVSHKMFSVENIDKLLSSQRSNGILYYRVKWKQPGSGSTWEYASSIPQVLIREFHASRTMSGKRRRRPLKGKHKFFEKAETASKGIDKVRETQGKQQVQQNKENKNQEKHVSSASTNLHSEESSKENKSKNKGIIGVKFIKGKPYFLKQSDQKTECLPVNMVHWDARDFITELMNRNKKFDDQIKIKVIQNKHATRPFDPLDGCMADIIHEVRTATDGLWEFLQTYRRLELPPEWRQFEDTSRAGINKLIDDLKQDYYRTVGRYRF